MITRLAPWQVYFVYSPITHLFFFGGVAAGKTFAGAEWAIKNILEKPDFTGLIGANTYDQLSQATLRVFLQRLEFYSLDYSIDSMPPPEWGEKRKFKSYKNIILVRNPETKKVTYIFTRVLSKPNPLRGIEFSWYWIDESRDTPENTHDVILGRLRENSWVQGRVTTTTNGEDWCYQRGVKMADRKLYGSMHIRTEEAVKLNIITREYYSAMLKTYSPMMALQELEAQHVNVYGGRAYYSSGPHNRMRRAPWGDAEPNRDRSLIVGCDFNFSPAPMCWVVGQVGPDSYGPEGQYWGECIHWFKELSGVEVSTVEMTQRLISEFPRFFYEVYGDMSGAQGTTSNAGQTDFNQIGNTLSDANCMYTISVEQMHESESRQNPKVRSRVENMNSRLKNALGEIRQTYDPESCPLLDGDFKMVGWKSAVSAGRGKLDDGGNKNRTHASDAAGYAVYKKFPPGVQTELIPSLPSQVREGMQY